MNDSVSSPPHSGLNSSYGGESIETKDALQRVIDSRLGSSDSRLGLNVVVCTMKFRAARVVSVYYSFTSGFDFD